MRLGPRAAALLAIRFLVLFASLVVTIGTATAASAAGTGGTGWPDSIAATRTTYGLYPAPGNHQPMHALSVWDLEKPVSGPANHRVLVVMRIGGTYLKVIGAGLGVDQPQPLVKHRHWNPNNYQAVHISGARQLTLATVTVEVHGHRFSAPVLPTIYHDATQWGTIGIRYYPDFHAAALWVSVNGIFSWYWILHGTACSQHQLATAPKTLIPGY